MEGKTKVGDELGELVTDGRTVFVWGILGVAVGVTEKEGVTDGVKEGVMLGDAVRVGVAGGITVLVIGCMAKVGKVLGCMATAKITMPIMNAMPSHNMPAVKSKTAAGVTVMLKIGGSGVT